jgi:hypothetical protein
VFCFAFAVLGFEPRTSCSLCNHTPPHFYLYFVFEIESH